MKRTRTMLARIGLILLGLSLPILGLEGLARWLMLAPPPIPNPTIWEEHPALGWWHIPESGGTFYSNFNEYQTEVTINSLGLRDDPFLNGYEVPAGTDRILILADSYGEALEVGLEETFFKQLEAKLSAHDRPTQTINAGVGGWGTDQQVTYYTLEGHKYRPDLTLLFFYVGNDVVNNYATFEVSRTGGSIQKDFYRLDPAGRLLGPDQFDRAVFETGYQGPKRLSQGDPQLLDVADWLWLNSHLYRWGGPYLQEIPFVLKILGPTGLLGGQAYISAIFPGDPITFFVYQTPPTQAWQAAWQLTESLIVQLRDQVVADGGQFAVVIIPTREQVYPEMWQRTRSRTLALQEITWDLHRPNQYLTSQLAENQIPYLDLLPIFEAQATQSNAPRYYLRRNGHWTPAGHALAAEALFIFLQDSALLDVDEE